MTIADILTKERARYLQALAKCLADHRREDPEAASEVLIQVNSTRLSGIYALIRPDILYRVHGEIKITELNKDEYFSFDPIVVSLSRGVAVRFTPLHWNGIEVRIRGDITDWGPFEDWAKYWMDRQP